MKITPYTPPFFLQGQSVEEIHQRMLNTLPDDLDKSQGQFPWDFTRPTAIEKAQFVEFTMNEAIKTMWPQWAYDEWLDRHGEIVSVERRGSNPAAAQLRIEGKPGVFFPAGFQFSTAATSEAAGIVFAAREAATIDKTGVAELWVEAIENGVSGNVPSDTIKLMVQPIASVTYIGNPKAATGGAEAESDDEYRPRVLEGYARQRESFVGCDADYRRWALEVDGVGGVVVIPEWLGSGTGTVKLVCTDRQGQPANQLILDEVYDHIIRPDDRMQRLAPTDALLTVVAPTMVPVSVSAEVWLSEGQSISGAQIRLSEELREYYQEAVLDGEIRYAKIGALLLGITGVQDYRKLTINGGTDNLRLTQEEYPETVEVTLHAK